MNGVFVVMMNEPSPATNPAKEADLVDERSDRAQNGGADADRTRDLVHAMDALYQLSYSPEWDGNVTSGISGAQV